MLLGLFALVAVLVYVANTALQYRAALEQYRRSSAIHDVGRITTDRLIDDAESLYAAESALLWKSRRAASLAHRKRLEWILERQESKRVVGLQGGPYDAYEVAINRIKKMLVELEGEQ